MFFFISWGSRVIRRLFGAPEQHYCEICHQERTFHNVVVYKVFHIWWIFRWVTQKTYARLCGVCQNGPKLAASAVEVKGAPSPIPFLDRMGWSIGVGGVAALGLMGFVSSASSSRQQAAELAHPQVGDVYEVDLAKLETHPEASEMYSAVQVASVAGDSVTVRMPKGYFTRETGAFTAVNGGRARSPDFYDTETVQLSLAALPKMQQDRVILKVER